MLTAKKALLGDTVVMRKLIECFMSQQSSTYQDMTKRSRRTAIAHSYVTQLVGLSVDCKEGVTYLDSTI